MNVSKNDDTLHIFTFHAPSSLSPTYLQIRKFTAAKHTNPHNHSHYSADHSHLSDHQHKPDLIYRTRILQTHHTASLQRRYPAGHKRDRKNPV